MVITNVPSLISYRNIFYKRFPSRSCLPFRLKLHRLFFRSLVTDSQNKVYPDDHFICKDPHTPILTEEVCTALRTDSGGTFLDMTFGAGGHSKRILEASSNNIVFGLDRDPSVKCFADQLLSKFPQRFIPLHGKFSDLPSLLRNNKIGPDHFDGILMDLGVSSMQFDTPQRGFMLSQDGPLDMRMDGPILGNEDLYSPSAAEILAHIDEDSLYKVLKYYGQEKKARIIARALTEARLLFKSIRTTKELAEVVASVTGIGANTDKLQRFSHPATKTFQALRILVNDELNELDYGIRAAHHFLKPNGILATISFHSLEDTIVKRHFTGNYLDATPDSIGASLRKKRTSSLKTYSESEIKTQVIKPWSPITKHVVCPTDQEIAKNPRSRSAKLRVASKEIISAVYSME